MNKNLDEKIALDKNIIKARFHPETNWEEVYLGNIEIDIFHLVGWTTKRLGIKAYDIAGNLSSIPNFHPFFVQRRELENAGFTIFIPPTKEDLELAGKTRFDLLEIV